MLQHFLLKLLLEIIKRAEVSVNPLQSWAQWGAGLLARGRQTVEVKRVVPDLRCLREKNMQREKGNETKVCSSAGLRQQRKQQGRQHQQL